MAQENQESGQPPVPAKAEVGGPFLGQVVHLPAVKIQAPPEVNAGPGIDEGQVIFGEGTAEGQRPFPLPAGKGGRAEGGKGRGTAEEFASRQMDGAENGAVGFQAAQLQEAELCISGVGVLIWGGKCSIP